MVHPPQHETPRDAGPFKAHLKCCTYSPFVPNFSLGKLKSLRGANLTPLGLFPSRAQDEARVGFGTDEKQKCDFLSANGASCTIWDSRPSVCASYFCLSSRGDDGQKFWQKAETLGNMMEWTLAHEILWQMGFTPAETEEMALAGQSRDQDRIERSWFEWGDRKAELFARAYEISQGMSAESVRLLLGSEGESLIAELSRAKALAT